MLHLEMLTEQNFQECLALTSGVEKEGFVDSVMYSLAEAWLYGDVFQPRAIYQDERLVGFVSLYVGEQHYQIINFLIDQTVQKQGIGKKAAELCIDYLKTEYKASHISAPVHEDYHLAKHFWKTLGFQESDVVEDGYIFMRLKI